MHFLARPDPCNFCFNGPVADKQSGDVRNPCRRHAGNICLAARTLTHGREDRVYRLIQTKQKTRHVCGRYGDRATTSNLFMEEWNHRTARGQHVSVADADVTRALTVEVGA